MRVFTVCVLILDVDEGAFILKYQYNYGHVVLVHINEKCRLFEKNYE